MFTLGIQKKLSFFLTETIVDFIYIESIYTMGKRKDRHSSSQRITFLFSFIALTKDRTAQLHRKGKIKNKIKTISNPINVFKDPSNL